MFWADRITDEIKERFQEKITRGIPLKLRDEKTLSGRVHVGSLRGVAIHGTVAQILTERGIPNTFSFELNDFDPMDEIPATLDRSKYEQYMGRPLFTVPSHVAGAETYPMVFGQEFREVITKLGFPVTYYRLQPEYTAGKFNETIRLALDHAKEIRAIYREVSGSQKPDDWYPLQVICEHCGKVGTTQVIGWDGKLVTYRCKKDLVKWAQGCGHQGTADPFDGRGKLPWKVEWPAKWKVFGVDIEGAGKDHSAAGGSRQIGKRISEEIFAYPNPFDIPYEFFNVGGKKMSASKGIGVSAKEISDLLPARLVRLLMIRKAPNQPIDFDPEGNTVPLLYDEYDRLAEHHFGRHPEPEPDFGRIFHLSQVDFPKPPHDTWHMRFTLVSFIIQMPHLDLLREARMMKGSDLTKEEEDEVQERADFAQLWLRTYAPVKYIFEFASAMTSLPKESLSLTEIQKKALGMIVKGLQETTWEGDPIHKVLHGVKAALALPPKDLFTPLYQLFFRRDEGPQMGWFLSTLQKEDVIQRIHIFSE